MLTSKFYAMIDHLDAGRMAVLAELNTAPHLLAHVMSIHGGCLS
jgi:hypothetical protein